MEANGIGGDEPCPDPNTAIRRVGSSAAPKFKPLRAAKQPNKTESRFGAILSLQLQGGDIMGFYYEGLTLRWGGGMRYTPDYVVMQTAAHMSSRSRILLIEVKGAHIWPRDLVRFKGCKAEWQQWFAFELWQEKKGEWRRLL